MTDGKLSERMHSATGSVSSDVIHDWAAEVALLEREIATWEQLGQELSTLEGKAEMATKLWKQELEHAHTARAQLAAADARIQWLEADLELWRRKAQAEKP